MAKIWGLDLRDIQWSKFKSSYMFKNKTWHLRRTKFVVYQLAMIFLVVSESLGTDVLSKYLDQKSNLQSQFQGIDVDNSAYIGIASYNIFIGIFAAFVFGGGFFFDLFFPERYEPRWVQNLWMGCAVFTCIGALGDALAFTIIVCLKTEIVDASNKSSSQIEAALRAVANDSPIVYRQSSRTIASVVLLWLGLVSAIISTIVMILFYRYVRATGTSRARHVVQNEKAGDFAEEVSSDKYEKPLSEETLHRANLGSVEDTPAGTFHDAATIEVADEQPTKHEATSGDHI